MRTAWSELRSVVLEGALGPISIFAFFIPVCFAAKPEPQQPQSLRTVASNDAGTFVVYDAAKPPRARRASSHFVAYWRDQTSGDLFVYDELLVEHQDVKAALAALERTFGPGLLDRSDVEAQRENAARIDPGGTWQPATGESVYRIMGFTGVAPPVPGPFGFTLNDCPFGCPDRPGGGYVPPGATHWSAPPAPAIDAPFEDVLLGAIQAADCCGGGGPPVPPGGDPPCVCCAVLRDGTLAAGEGELPCCQVCCEGRCDDGNECTEDDRCGLVEGPDIICTNSCCGEIKDCEDWNPCTIDWCDPQTGNCTPRAACIGRKCCPTDEGHFCCQVGEKVCCADADVEHCCDPGQTCCGNGCCEANEPCCNGACCEPEETECCNGQCCDGVCCQGACCQDDGDPCTIEYCGAAGECLHGPPPCDDGEECTNDYCLGGECYNDPRTGAACEDDNNPCTNDLCDSAGLCAHPPKPAFTPCPDEGNPCTEDWCIGGACVHPAGNDGATCADEGNACTNDVCLSGACTHPCKPACTACPNGWCLSCACVAEQCSVSLSSSTGAPCETVEMVMAADCYPDCGSSMSFDVDVEYPPGHEDVEPWLEVETPNPKQCGGGGKSIPVEVTIHGDAPEEDAEITITGTTTGGGQCEATATLTVEREYDDVEIQYKTFIACEVAGPTPPDFTLYDFFRGDNRGFGYGPGFGAAASRTFQEVVVTMDPANETRTIGTPTQIIGITQGFNDDPDGSDVIPLATPYCQGQCSYGFVPGASPDCTGTTPDPVGDGLLDIEVIPLSSTSFKVVITNRAQDQCEQFVPGIDVDLVLEFRQICENGVLKPLEFRASGSYDGYPWHELYLNGVIVFLHDPCITGEGPSSMVGSGEHNFDGTGQFPEIDPSQTGINLSVWQPVPGVP